MRRRPEAAGQKTALRRFELSGRDVSHATLDFRAANNRQVVQVIEQRPKPVGVPASLAQLVDSPADGSQTLALDQDWLRASYGLQSAALEPVADCWLG
jgi:hypothetical protein